MTSFERLIASVACALIMSACGGGMTPVTTVATSSTLATTTTEAANWEVYLDEEELRIAAQEIVDRFGEAIGALGIDLGDPPTVVVDNSPALIYYNETLKRIGVPFWETVDDGAREAFSFFAGGDPARAEDLFRAVMNKFMIVHEAGHWLQHWGEMLEFRTDLYGGEVHANQVAVAFWMTQPGGEEFLKELEPMFQTAVNQLPDPTPPGVDPVEFFNENYYELGPDPMRYGFYQFAMMLDAVQHRSTLVLEDLIPRRD